MCFRNLFSEHVIFEGKKIKGHSQKMSAPNFSLYIVFLANYLSYIRNSAKEMFVLQQDPSHQPLQNQLTFLTPPERKLDLNLCASLWSGIFSQKARYKQILEKISEISHSQPSVQWMKQEDQFFLTIFVERNTQNLIPPPPL